MPERPFVVIAGALAGRPKARATRLQDNIAKRWRMGGTLRAEPEKSRDVIPLLDGWIRRLEREAGAQVAHAAQTR